MKTKINQKHIIIIILLISLITFSLILVNGLDTAEIQPNLKNLTTDTNSLILSKGCSYTDSDINTATYSKPIPYYNILQGHIDFSQTGCEAEITNLMDLTSITYSQISLQGVKFSRIADKYVFSKSGLGKVNLETSTIYLKIGSDLEINLTNGKIKPFEFNVKTSSDISSVLECVLPVTASFVNVKKTGMCCYRIDYSGQTGTLNIPLSLSSGGISPRTIELQRTTDYAIICQGQVKGNFFNSQTAAYKTGPFNIQSGKGRINYNPSTKELNLPDDSVLNDLDVKKADGTIINGENIKIGNDAWEKIAGKNNDKTFDTFSGKLKINTLKKSNTNLDDKFLFSIPKEESVTFKKPSVEIENYGKSDTLLFFDDYEKSVNRLGEINNKEIIRGGLEGYFYETGKYPKKQSYMTLNQNRITGYSGEYSSPKIIFENSNIAGFNLQENQYMETTFYEGEYIIEDSNFITSKDSDYKFINGRDKLTQKGGGYNIEFLGGKLDKEPTENLEMYSYSGNDMDTYQTGSNIEMNPGKKVFSGQINKKVGDDLYASSFSMTGFSEKPSTTIYKGQGQRSRKNLEIVTYAGATPLLREYYDELRSRQ